MFSWIPLLPELRAPYSNRTSGMRDEVISAHGNLGIQKVTGQSAHRAPAGCWCVVWSAVVLDLAWKSFREISF
jgi:hypothetical protein